MAAVPSRTASTHQIVAGHPLAARVGLNILDSGGNAVDAGVGAGLALCVVHSEQIQISGTAPMILYVAERGQVTTIAGVGRWPQRATVDYFIRHCGGRIPLGVMRQLVPGAPDAWVTALERYGTWSFADVLHYSIKLAREGFPVCRDMARQIRRYRRNFVRWPVNAQLYLPNGDPLSEGDHFVQADLASTLQFLADEERSAVARTGSRHAGMDAVRHAFYRGDIARAFADYHKDNGGLLTRSALAGYRVREEPPISFRYRGYDIYTCGPWSQGPVLLQMLSLLPAATLCDLSHNSAAYIHLVTEAMKLAYADRERYYGDPEFVDVPTDMLLDPEYARKRRKLIDPRTARLDMPEPEFPMNGGRPFDYCSPAIEGDDPLAPADTSYLCVADRWGNVFSATPSDPTDEAPIVPGTGMNPSPRGGQAFVVDGHPNAIGPGKRPRVTPSLAMAIKPGRKLVAWGGPGADISPQAMLQVFLNYVVYGFDLQSSIESSRFSTFSFPSSWDPHPRCPGRLGLEQGIAPETLESLAKMGHLAALKTRHWPRSGGVWSIVRDLERGMLEAGVDPRRNACAMGR